MPWKSRPRGQPYYVRSIWRNGRTEQEYVGAGPMAELIAAEDEEHRQARAKEEAEFDAWRKRLEKIDAEFAAYDAAVTELFNAWMAANGYHRHNRGKWRKRRQQKGEN